MIDLGTVRPGSTIYIPFATYDSNDPSASVTLTGLLTSDIEVYKDGSVTQRASDSGYALLDTDGIDFDGITGIHGFSIDLADNTTAGFWAAGSQYWVVVSSVTVDAATINFIAATFRIGYPDAVLNTTIATLSSQTSFTLTAGPAEDDALNGCIVRIHDVASAVQAGFAVVQDYTGSTKTVTLAAGTTFTAAASDNIAFFPPALVPTVLGRTLDVASGGEAGVDFSNINGTLDAAEIGTGAITSAKFAAGAIDAAAIADNAIDAGAIASGAITAAKFAAGAIDAAAIATGAIDADALAADAVAEIADGVWDEDATGHQTGGTFGQAIGDPGADTNTIFKAVVTDATGATIAADIITIDDLLDTEVAALTTELAKVPKSDSNVTWNATAAAQLQSEATDALNAYDPPTRAEATADKDEIIAYLAGLVIAKGTIGSTGNSTTTLHLTGLTYGDDEVNNYLLAIKDVSAGEWHARYIEDWADTGDLATVATLPFTPENAVDTYVILAFRQDVTGGSGLDAAGVRAAVGLAAANLDTQLTAIDDYLDTEVGALTTELAKVPKSDGSVGWNATARAQIQTEAEDALVTHRLDELLNADSDIDGAAPPTVGSVFHELMSKTAGSFTFDQTTDSLEAVRDKEADIETDTQDIQSRLPAALVSGRMDASVGAMAADVLTAAAAASDLGTEIAAAVWASASRTLTALGFTLGASDLAADTIGASELAADAITEIVNAIWTTQLTEAYNTDGAAPTGAQALFVIMQRLVDFAISSTTITVKKIDGTTTAYTLTLDSATDPTSSSRAT